MSDEPQDEYCTVVYRIKGGRDAFRAWWQTIHPNWNAEPIGVVAAAAYDAIKKCDELEEALGESERHDET